MVEDSLLSAVVTEAQLEAIATGEIQVRLEESVRCQVKNSFRTVGYTKLGLKRELNKRYRLENHEETDNRKNHKFG